MKKLTTALLLALLIFQTIPKWSEATAQEAAKSIQPSSVAVHTLSNQEILRMVRAEFSAETILFTIKSAACNFVTTPAALRQLKEEGVPDAVILAMVMAPKSDAAAEGQSANTVEPQKDVTVKIRNGLVVEVEAPFTMNSQDLRKGDAISFRVVNPVKVDGLLVIAEGATATARVTQAERGGHFGRAGRLAWTMQDVTAVDGTRIPLQATGRIVGDSKGAKVATAMIITGAAFLLFAPVALLHGFKRGENAILPAGKRLEVFVQGDATVNATAR